MAVPAALLLLDDIPLLHRELADGLRLLAEWGLNTDGDEFRELTMFDESMVSLAEYVPLALHLHLAAFRRLFESMAVNLWSACEDAMPGAIELVRAVERYTDIVPPVVARPLVMWQALCLLEYANLAKRDTDVELVDSIVHQIISSPGTDGSFHPNEVSESEKATWADCDLIGLHALAKLALLRRNPGWAARVEEIALYHQKNTQLDDTGGEPWGLFGFIWSPKTREFADAQIHYVRSTSGRKASSVSGLLLADAADSLKDFDV